MRLVSNVLMLFLASLLFVACGDDDKKENGNGNGNGNGGDDGLTLKFDGLADFKEGADLAEFKVGVYDGSVADDKSTLEITVKITCGDDEASKKANAVAGVATFKASDFDDIDFTTVVKGKKCSVAATAEGATENKKEVTVLDKTAPAATGLTITDKGKITAPAGSTVTISGCDAHIVKWASAAASMAVANKDSTTGLAAGDDLYLAGAATGCTLTAGSKTLNTFTNYTAADAFGATTIDTDAEFKPAWTTPNTDDRDFKWFAYSSATMKASGDETGHSTTNPVDEVTGLTNTNKATWKIFVLYNGSVEQIH